MPKFSIILPCYNATDTLPETLDSIRAQTVTDWEAICVDDGSTDDTCDLIRTFAARDPRFRLATHSGKGPSAARNAGVMQHARGQMISFCDADDLWQPEKLARAAAVMADPDVGGAYGKVAFFSGNRDNNMRLSTLRRRPLRVRDLLAENAVCTMSNLTVRRDLFEATGGFDQTMVHNEDLDWLIRLVGDGARVVGDPTLHVLYRTNIGGLSSDIAAMAAGRQIALATARLYGITPDNRDEAVFARYLARRALRLETGAADAFRHTLTGLRRSPRAFLFPLRRGAATAVASLVAPVVPRALRMALFAA